MKPLLKVTVLMDAAAMPADDPDFAGDVEATTEYHVVTALRELGHQVSILGVHRNAEIVVTTLVERKPDIVFNLTEQFRDKRRLDANIAGLLELIGVPFTGSGSAGLMLSRDKNLCKQLLSLHRIRIPGFVALLPGKSIHIPKTLRFPMVVKPALEDGSEGISNASLVKDESALRERAQMVHDRWHQPAIAEEYVEGRELYVSILGNRRLSVFPARELFFKAENSDGPLLATYRVKWDKEYQEKWQIGFGPAKLGDSIIRDLARVCKRLYRILQIRDYGRIDIRLTPENKIVILEVNPNPDLAYGDELAEAAEKSGLSYNKLIDRILRLAIRRYDES